MTTAFVNNVKTAVLLALLFGLFVFVGGMVGGSAGLLIAGAFGLVTNLAMWWGSDKLAIAAMRGERIDPQSPGGHKLQTMVERLSERAGIPAPRVYICPQEAPNAFATGRSPKHGAVAVTRGALRLLDDRELEGVMAHELAHIKNRDTLTSTIAGTIAGIFSMLAQWAMFMSVFGGRREGGHPFAMIAMLLLGAFGAAVIKSMISRSREFVADADGAAIAGSPDGLASALRKLESVAQSVPMRQPNPAMNNLFIVEPFVGKGLTELFASHPPTEVRIRKLLER